MSKKNPKIWERLWDLIEAVVKDPFSGIGKPEPLKHIGSNIWSRRIDREHRLVYRVEQNRILFLPQMWQECLRHIFRSKHPLKLAGGR